MSKEDDLELLKATAMKVQEKLEALKNRLFDSLASTEFGFKSGLADREELLKANRKNIRLFEQFVENTIHAFEVCAVVHTKMATQEKVYDPKDTAVYPGTYAAMSYKPPSDPDIVYKHLVGMNTSNKFH